MGINIMERFKIEFSPFGITMIPLMIAINVVAGYLAAGTPVWMDTIGSMLAGLILGPFNGLVVGALTNIFKFLTFDPFALPYAIVNAAIGLVAGIFALTGWVKQEKTANQIVRVLIASIILALVATFTSTPLNVAFWGGYTGKSWVDLIFAGFLASGWDVFTASLTAEFISDIVDKTLGFFISWIIYLQLPPSFVKTRADMVE
ncbi:MAG: ECF transporter S component [Candidatus Odinarchaeota archaeon]|nr:ECF transporter S component [Candidatus Odinarchaeota archaeon]